MLIAQVSDIHAAPDNDHLARFDRVLRWLRQLQPDALVLSGDLTDNDWLEGYQQIAARLAEEHYPSLILPGNSDNRRLMRAVWRDETGANDTCDGASGLAGEAAQPGRRAAIHSVPASSCFCLRHTDPGSDPVQRAGSAGSLDSPRGDQTACGGFRTRTQTGGRDVCGHTSTYLCLRVPGQSGLVW